MDADGKLTHVQPIGADPKHFDADSTEPYGVGAFLLAGSEVYRMAALTPIQHGEFLLFTHSDSGTKLYGFHEGFAVKVTNPVVVSTRERDGRNQRQDDPRKSFDCLLQS